MSLGKGIKDGLAIGLGYLSVSFSFGILAVSSGLSWWQAVLISLTNLTSAGQVAAVGIMGAAGGLIEMAVTTLVINMRYSLMAISLSQKTDETMTTPARLVTCFVITDEIFGISAARKGKLKPSYVYGAMSVAIPGWTLGTALGVVLGDVLPGIIVSALSLALYGMFIAIVIPATSDKHTAYAVLIAVVMSTVCTYAPLLKEIPSGTRIIILTVLVSLIAAVLWPVKEEGKDA